MQLSDVLRFVEATLDKLSAAKAQELARQIAAGEGKDQAAKLAQELLDWSQRNRDRMRDVVAREVSAQLSTIGVASTKDIDALKRRVRELERATAVAKSGRKKSPTKKSATKRTTRPSAAKRTAASTVPVGRDAGSNPED